MDTNIIPIHLQRFLDAVNTDFLTLSKKYDKFRLIVDIKRVLTYSDMQKFYKDYDDYLSYLSKTQIELIFKDVEWDQNEFLKKTVNKFKDLLKHNSNVIDEPKKNQNGM